MSVRKVVKKLIPKGVFPAVEPYGHLLEAFIFHALAGFPAKKMKVIGVTGTNGKTTTSFLIHRMLTEAGYKAGLMTTAAWGVGKDIEPQLDHMTNVPVPTLTKRLKQMKSQGVEWLVLETTSQALAQNRVWGVPYSVVVFTNITQDHLDWHGSFENYLTAKRKLFKLANKNTEGKRTGIVNIDDPNADKFIADIKNPVTYGILSGDLKAKNISLSPLGSKFTAVFKEKKLDLQINLPGRFNIYNALAAASVGGVIGLSKEQIEQGLAALEGVEGRMEAIEAGQNYGVVVDFAHSPDALRQLLSGLKEVTKGKVKIVFGATGDRDKSKRPEMGKVAAELADEIFLTDDETYTEDPELIINAVLEGIRHAGGTEKTTVIPDRFEAITEAFKSADEGDVVALAGIGSENYRNMGGKALPWDEREIAKKIIEELK